MADRVISRSPAMDVSLPQRLLDLLFPPRCVHCERAGAALCDACRATIIPAPAPRCSRCDQSLFGATGPRCTHCAALGERPVTLERIVVAALYDGAAASAIRALKFRGQRRLALPLAALQVDAVRRAGLMCDVVIPVPLHAARLRTRGYNQAALLARPLARSLGAPLRPRLLMRDRATQAQTRLTPRERQRNVAGAFALAPGAVAALAGKRVLLVDDVTTTGATLDAAADALVEARPAAIYALIVARPLRRFGPEPGDALDEPYA